MIVLPEGFDYALLFSDFMKIASPLLGVASIVSAGFLIVRILRKGI